MLRIIQKWIIQIIQFWMIYKHAQNHPKVDHTTSDNLQACSESSKSGSYKSSNFGWSKSMLRIFQKWIIQNIQFRMISSTFQFYIGNNRHVCISSKFGWYTSSHIWQIIHIWMICVDHKSFIFGSGTYLWKFQQAQEQRGELQLELGRSQLSTDSTEVEEAAPTFTAP